MKSNEAKQYSTAQNRTEQNRKEHDKVKQYKAAN
jgi:hypothetical protein